MSYQVLARKWRPKTFKEMAGQEHVLKALINALDNDRLHHAYLFTGTRGVGKTSIARILAKSLNCLQGVSSEPCGECSACVEISEGRFVDLIEVDAASRTKVEDTRELLENVQYAPTAGRFKVYLIDEVHMLSTHSFNALLKTLEEPPPHVKFLLATTDPQKLPATILSRCLQFNLKNMSPERIVNHLKTVLTAEQVDFEEPALWMLGRSADGSMRDAMSLTDQAIAFGSGNLTELDVGNMLGAIDQTAIYQLLTALIHSDGATLLQKVAHIADHSPDYEAATESLLSLLHRVSVAQAVPEAIDNSFGDADKIEQFAQQMAVEDVQLYYQLCLHGRRDLPLAPEPRTGFEMLLLRLLAFKPAGIPDIPTAHLQNGSQNDSHAQAAVSIEKPAEEAEAPASIEEPLRTEPAETAVNHDYEGQVYPETSDLQATEVPDSVKKSEAAIKTEQALPEKSAAKTFSVTQKLASFASDNVAIATEPVTATSQQVSGATQRKDSQQSNANQVDTIQGVSNPSANEIKADVPAPVNSGSLVSDVSSTVEKAPDPVQLSELNSHDWPKLFSRLKFGGVLGNVMSHCVLTSADGNNLAFCLDEENSTLFNESYVARLSQHLSEQLKSEVSASISLGRPTSETPAHYLKRMAEQRQQAAIASLQADPIVQSMVENFDAKLIIESIKSID